MKWRCGESWSKEADVTGDGDHGDPADPIAPTFFKYIADVLMYS